MNNCKQFVAKILLIISIIKFVLCEHIDYNVLTREQYENHKDEFVEYFIPKCCDISERLTTTEETGSQCTSNVDQDVQFEPILYRGNRTGFLRKPLNYTKLNVIVGNPCQYGKYPLDPENFPTDEYYIYDNGILFVPGINPRFFGMDRFCLEYKNDDKTVTPFVCFESVSAETPNDNQRAKLYAIGLLISVPFLLATFLVYTLIPELRTVHGKCLACHVICLAIAFFALALVQLMESEFPDDLCVTIAFVIEFFFIACFFWLNVMCFDIWLNITLYLKQGTSKEQETQHFLYYSIYAWSCPTIILVISLIMDLDPSVPVTYIKPEFGKNVCWFNSDKAALPYFYGPIGVLIFFNIVLFILSAKEFASTIQSTRIVIDIRCTEQFVTVLDMKQRWRKYKKLFRICFLLFVVMGINWSMEVLSWLVDGTFMIWTVFDIINALQGVLIFCIFVLQRPVRQLLVRKILRKNEYDSSISSDFEMQPTTYLF